MTTDDGQLSFDLLGAESDPPQQVWETFAPARLRQARVLASKKKTEVAAMVGVSAAAIGQYEAGVVRPKQDHILGLAKALNVVPGFFAAGRPLEPLDTCSTHFRSLRSIRATDRDRALATAEQAWELSFALETRIQFPGANLPRVAKSADEDPLIRTPRLRLPGRRSPRRYRDPGPSGGAPGNSLGGERSTGSRYRAAR